MALQPVRDITPALVPAAVFLLLGAWTVRGVWKGVKEADSHIRAALETRNTAIKPNKERQE